jgi:hypothetical protein
MKMQTPAKRRADEKHSNEVNSAKLSSNKPAVKPVVANVKKEKIEPQHLSL